MNSIQDLDSDRFLRAFDLSQSLLRNPEGRITFWSKGMERLYGFPESQAVGRVGHDLLETVLPCPLNEIEATLQRVGRWQGKLIRKHRNGQDVHVVSRWTCDTGPADEGDAVIEVDTDVTEMKLEDLEKAKSIALLRTVLAMAPGLIYAKDRQGRMLVANPAALELIGKPWSEVKGRTDLEFLDDQTQARLIMANDRRVIEAGQTEVIEETVTCDGSRTVWLSTKTPVLLDNGSDIGIVGISLEITERKRAEWRTRMLMHELNHRVKNILATVQSVALQTLRDSDCAVSSKLNARLMAIGSSFDLLTADRWESADLLDVIALALAPHGGLSNPRFDVRGPELRLAPNKALSMAMVLHELATNALKYGALSVPGGRIEVFWDIDLSRTPEFRFSWTEKDGAPVTPPTRRGFGLSLIKRSLAQDLEGVVEIDFPSTGVVCSVVAPLDALPAVSECFDYPELATNY